MDLKFYSAFVISSIVFFSSATSESSQQIRWVRPVEGTVSNSFGHGYGFYGYYRAGHTGIDIKAKVGTKVLAVDNGVVKFVKTKRNMRYGNYIVIQHPNGLCTLYGHLQKVLVKLNQVVKQSDIVGMTGVSGLASYPHIHFEVIDRVPVRDGAWGYNYICKLQRITNKSEKDKNSMLSKQIYDLVPLTEIKEKFSFMNVDHKEIKHFYRMRKGHCIEESINPLVYYNPEKYLPKYEHSDMPDFNSMRRSRNRIISSKLKAIHPDPE
ncbi:MAG: M23 family metallopeptidase [Candidatus Sericytochromatia bacterium]|nr:M23 family metallopeptidase [Candidatus Sericytochromatia bacterium]